jgi:hypothetical protein
MLKHLARLKFYNAVDKWTPAFPWTLSSREANMGQTTMPVRLRELARAGLAHRVNIDGKTAFYLSAKGKKLLAKSSK